MFLGKENQSVKSENIKHKENVIERSFLRWRRSDSRLEVVSWKKRDVFF